MLENTMLQLPMALLPSIPRRNLILFVIISGFLFWGSLPACGASSGGNPAEHDTLSVMSFNIRYGTANDRENRWEKRHDLVYDILRSNDCDAIGLQEALHFQLEAIQKAVPGWSMLGVGRDDGKTKGEYAAILYQADRLRVVDSGTFWFSDTPEVVASASWGNSIPRICTWGRFQYKESGRAFYIFNVHLDHVSQPSRFKSAMLVAQRIAQRKYPDPVVLTGDFNAGESNPAIRYLTGEAKEKPAITLVDTFRVLHPNATDVGTFNGFHGDCSGDKIDYVFTEPDIEVLEAKIIRDMPGGRCPSDHFPVLARIKLPK